MKPHSWERRQLDKYTALSPTNLLNYCCLNWKQCSRSWPSFKVIHRHATLSISACHHIHIDLVLYSGCGISCRLGELLLLYAVTITLHTERLEVGCLRLYVWQRLQSSCDISRSDITCLAVTHGKTNHIYECYCFVHRLLNYDFVWASTWFESCYSDGFAATEQRHLSYLLFVSWIVLLNLINPRIAVLIHKVLNGSPARIADESFAIHHAISHQVIPAVTQVSDCRTFTVAAPRTLNSLPESVTSVPSLECFEQPLKTFSCLSCLVFFYFY